ncbi:Light-sensor Protein kinase [Pleurotus pulmonarius]|nr:Light-sensor Protein kinase [Pleurotus pulmonarius]
MSSLDQRPASESPPISPVSTSPASSIVYPIKSLLTGKFQSARQNSGAAFTELSRSRSEDNIHGALDERADYSTENGYMSRNSWHDPLMTFPPTSDRDWIAPVLERRHSSNSLDATTRSASSIAHRKRTPSPNYRHYPAEDYTDFPRTFATSSFIEQDRHISRETLTMETLSSVMSHSTEVMSPSLTEIDAPDAGNTVPEAASDALLPSSGNVEVSSPTTSTSTLPFNPSQYGLVHLGPLSTTQSNHSRNSSHSYPGPGSVFSSDSKPSTYYSTETHLTGPGHVSPAPIEEVPNGLRLASESLDRRTTSHLHVPPFTYSQDSSAFPSLAPSPTESDPQRQALSTAESPPLSLAVTDTSDRDATPVLKSSALAAKAKLDSDHPSEATPSNESHHHHTTFRYKHQKDEDGHHVIIGREGTLYKCEDEPIRTPGAVQGFGVLVVVEETEDALVVRQLSENSDQLLGLPARYLFSLECFTDTLPESQANLLWDNIQFLQGGIQSVDDDSPHVFLLSGFGAPGTLGSSASGSGEGEARRSWTCWCAIHRPKVSEAALKRFIIMEFELEKDALNPLYPPGDPDLISPMESTSTNSTGDYGWNLTSSSHIGGPPSESSYSSFSVSLEPASGEHDPPDAAGSPPNTLCADDIIASTTTYSKPIPALERLRRMAQTKPLAETSRSHRQVKRGNTDSPGRGSVGMMDVFAVVSQMNEQLGAAGDLLTFLNVLVGVIKDLTQFHRVMTYQFDESWNGIVVAELVDWSKVQHLYRGLHFPASDIPSQARTLYATNKVRLLYDRAQTTARIIVRNSDDLLEPLDMSHCYLRAMSPIHIKYLANMGVRASMSISIMAFGTLWGLVACHSFGSHGMRVSFPVRQILRLLSQSISRNIERLSYAQRFQARKLTGYLVSDADDLLKLFDADYGVLVVGDGAKVLGPNQHGQDILIVAEYLRLTQFEEIRASQSVHSDFPDLNLSTGLEVIAGLLYVPLSTSGHDFIAFLRKGQLRSVRWAGRPRTKDDPTPTLEPRSSFKIWSETVAGKCRAWTDEQLETAGVLALVYGKFIEVWRQKQEALHTTSFKLCIADGFCSTARTSLNHIINYLEMAMNGQLDVETRDNLRRSHAASKSLLFTINDLLDLTRLESGNETSFHEVFNLSEVVKDAAHLYSKEAERRGIAFAVDVSECPTFVIGDAKKVKTVIQNLTANALKFTEKGKIEVSCVRYMEPEGLRSAGQMAVNIVVSDTGCGIAPEKLESMLREFEQVEIEQPRSGAGLGLGLAVVARIVEQLGGQLRVDSKVDEGSRFSFLMPSTFAGDGQATSSSGSSRSSLQSACPGSRNRSRSSKGSELERIVEAMSTHHMNTQSLSPRISAPDPSIPRPVKIDDGQVDVIALPTERLLTAALPIASKEQFSPFQSPEQLRILIVEDNDINRVILSKRLRNDGHAVADATNGREGVDQVEADREFDLILMDIQMPILNGFEATQRIRELEKEEMGMIRPMRVSHQLNGRLPIFVVSATLTEHQHDELVDYGVDGWILKPIDFKRLRTIMKGLTDLRQRRSDLYELGCSWEAGGWLRRPSA